MNKCYRKDESLQTGLTTFDLKDKHVNNAQERYVILATFKVVNEEFILTIYLLLSELLVYDQEM